MSPDPAALGDRGRLVVVGSQSEVREDVLRLAATTGIPAQTIEAAELSEAAWGDADLVVIDASAADQVSGKGLPRRAGVVIATSSPPSVALWAAAVAIGVEEVMELPGAGTALIERLSDVPGGSGRLGELVAVIGGAGGAGASTLAVAMALSAAREGRRPVLLGTDPWDGGIDLTLGAEDVPGPRWPDLAEISGRLSSTAIDEGLPYAHGVRFLCAARRRPGPVAVATLTAVVTAARRSGGPVVVDLPRGVGESARWLRGVLDLGVVVCPATVSAALAARALVTELQWTPGTSGIAVRRRLGHEITDDVLAAAVGLPVLVRIPEDSRLRSRQQRGEPPGLSGRGSLAKSCATLWQLAGGRSAAAA